MKKFNSIFEAENWLREKEEENVNLDTTLHIQHNEIFFEGGKFRAKITLNALCKYIRENEKISQREIAEKVGVRIATISDFETGKKGINSKTLELIFQELKINVE